MKYVYITYDTYSPTSFKNVPTYPEPIILIKKNLKKKEKNNKAFFIQGQVRLAYYVMPRGGNRGLVKK